MRLRTETVALVIALLFGAVTCLSAVGAEPTRRKGDEAIPTGPVWPRPPDPARIRFLKSVDGASDWGVARNWFGRIVDTVTGRREAQFVRPTGVAVQDGILYVADPGAQMLVVFDAPRHKEWHITRLGDKPLVSPVAVTPGPAGTVFVADSYLREILQLNRDGKLLRVIAHGDLQRPSSVAFDAHRRRLYVGDSKANVVHVFDEQGDKVNSFGGLGAGPGQFNSPTHLALTPEGEIAVTDALNFRVQVFNADGRFKYELGKIGDGAGNFAAPKGVAVDREGHHYVADAMFDAIQVFDAQGRLLLGFGDQGTQPGQFWIPNGLYVDAEQRLFVADAYNRRIQVFQIVPESSPPPDDVRGSQP
jgi:DNA-binding beta-propeller fold protein YncE